VRQGRGTRAVEASPEEGSGLGNHLPLTRTSHAENADDGSASSVHPTALGPPPIAMVAEMAAAERAGLLVAARRP
jgi:hypothetical protein